MLKKITRNYYEILDEFRGNFRKNSVSLMKKMLRNSKEIWEIWNTHKFVKKIENFLENLIITSGVKCKKFLEKHRETPRPFKN